MTTSPNDLDQSDVNADARDMYEEELFNLDTPPLDITDALLLLEDAFEVPALALITALIESPTDNPDIADLRTAHGSREVDIMIEMIYAACDSSSYLPIIQRSLELCEAIASL